MANELMTYKQQTVDVIESRVNKLQQQGNIHLPAGYSASNALKSAWLILQDVVDKDGKAALVTCDQNSITNALFDMCIQGLNPAKKQAYFVVFGKKLILMRSYFGSMAVAKMVDPTIEGIYAEVVYEGDAFDYQIRRGKKEVINHKQQLGNLDKSKIIGAYAEVVDYDGNVKRTEIMSYEEILQSWKQSRMNPFDQNGKLKAGTTHSKFTADMCKRTVINKVCKPIINSSSDNELLQAAINRAGDEMAEEQAQEEVQAKANQGPVIDIEPDDQPPYPTEYVGDEQAQPEQQEQPEPTPPPYSVG